jgi:hypothetical protein
MDALKAGNRNRIATGVLKRWAAAIEEYRPSEVAAAFTQDAIFQGFDEAHVVGRAAVAAYYAKQPPGLTASFRILELRQITSNDLLVYSDVDFTRPDATVIPVHLTAVLRNAGGQWQISHYHVSKIERTTGPDAPAGPEHTQRNAS